MQHTQHTDHVIRTLLAEKGKKLDVWSLTRKTGYMLDTVHAVEELSRAGFVKARDSVVTLTNVKNLPAYLRKKDTPLTEVMRAYARLCREVRFANTDFDQLMLKPSAIRNKLTLMQRRGDLLNRDILCIGDDDLFSVACALTGLPKSVTVVDADKEVVRFLQSVAPKLPVPIHATQHNLHKPLPKKYHDRFDVFITEPPETVSATLLFVMEGIRTLRARGVFYLGMTEVTMDERERHVIEKRILESGVVFTDMLHGYEEYAIEGNELTDKNIPSWITRPPRTSWFVSTLFRAAVAREKRPRVVRISADDLKTRFPL